MAQQGNDRIVIGPSTSPPRQPSAVDYTTEPPPQKPQMPWKWKFALMAAGAVAIVVGISKTGGYFDDRDKAAKADLTKNHVGPVLHSKLATIKPSELRALAQGELSSKKYIVVPVPDKEVHLAIGAMEIGADTPAGKRLKQATAFAANTGKEEGGKPQEIKLSQAQCYLTSAYVVEGARKTESFTTGASPEGRTTGVHDFIVCVHQQGNGLLTPMRPGNNGALSDVGSKASFLHRLGM